MSDDDENSKLTTLNFLIFFHKPVEFWKSNKENYPILYHVFLRIFCVPATSVPSEELFSAAGYTVCDRRNRLSPENVRKIMLVNQNLP